jgi:hypothetical protein
MKILSNLSSGDFTPGGKNRLCNIPLTLLRNAKRAELHTSKQRALKLNHDVIFFQRAGNGVHTYANKKVLKNVLVDIAKEEEEKDFFLCTSI